MIINIPIISRADTATLNEVFFLIRDAFQQVAGRRTALDRVLLRAPGGAVYAIKVDDAGTLSTEEIDGNARD